MTTEEPKKEHKEDNAILRLGQAALDGVKAYMSLLKPDKESSDDKRFRQGVLAFGAVAAAVLLVTIGVAVVVSGGWVLPLVIGGVVTAAVGAFKVVSAINEQYDKKERGQSTSEPVINEQEPGKGQGHGVGPKLAATANEVGKGVDKSSQNTSGQQRSGSNALPTPPGGRANR